VSLTTATNYKTWTGQSATTPSDTQITLALGQAETLVAQVLNRADGGLSRLETTTGTDITEYYDGAGLKTLYLRAYPIVSIASVSYLSSVASGAASYTAFDTGTYYTHATTGRLIRSGYVDFGFDADETSWPDGEANIQVVYQGGYTSGTLPEDLKECIYEVASMILHNRPGTREEQVTDELRALILERVGHHQRTAT
jgi:hypothetical protein